MTGW